ncbi:MAG: hypothetical protein H6718_09530 [Polyangiaceae bacterium]|nr:hypothetical protein [Polyangiaceae bacterium]MCB9606356.1 hypothetical protein [Polyangiaceae bacterium]
MAAVPQIKGLSTRSVFQALGTLRGPEVAEQVIERLVASAESQELGELLRLGGILASTWYPLAWHGQLMRAVRQVTGEGPELIWALGRESTAADLSSVHKMFMGLLAPHTVLSVSPRMFGNYYDTGKVQVSESRKGYGLVEWSGCRGFDANLWTEILGGSEALLEAAGAKSIAIQRLHGGGNGQDFMRADANWL